MGGKNSTQQGLNVNEKTTLDIAVTGVQGAGRSSLVKALRGLSDFDEDAAEIGVKQPTFQPVGYPHPAFPDVTIWVLPGIGTPDFKTEEYLQNVNYSQYDFFIIVASEHFTIYDIQLSHTIQKMKKQFYYVHSKMDARIKTEKQNPDFSEEAILQRVRKYCLDNLVEAGISSPEIFLISSWYAEKYDFPHLQKIIANEMEDFKKCASAVEKENHQSALGISWEHASGGQAEQATVGLSHCMIAPSHEASLAHQHERLPAAFMTSPPFVCRGDARHTGKGEVLQAVGGIGIHYFLSKAAFISDLVKLKVWMAQKSIEEVKAEICQSLEALENTNLNIAITGVSGTGKSSFVNALRGMTDFEKDAAKVGCIETTKKPKEYPHPTFPKVTLWDLPGIGTKKFQPKDYLETVNFNKYDFFIIVSSERFTANDAMLAEEIQKREKKFYFVRSKMDVSIAAEAMNPNFDMDKTIEEIRTYCCENLKKEGETPPRVFLVSRRDLKLYDFPLLQETFENDLDDLKKQTFIASLPVFSKKVLKKKKAAMEDLIWKVATKSCSIAMIPLPGLSLVCDLDILVSTMKFFCQVFGLDEDCLQRVAKLGDKNYNVLKSAIKKSPLSSEITPEFVKGLLEKSLLCSTVKTAQIVLDFIPLLGYLAGGPSSFITTFHMLKKFLRDLVEDAENVRAKAAEP
ncbi:interferon-inducible GTPase 5-like [Sphaerodactylus townsendi]|uniref:interferon-inducible GTPase 5-like n=1 Tax=Sphaerodactylus townsendi TaxID=933632 RepID=UPI0020265A53|nr:interferon-inducible GTPase 5-like [Sphaerodactylus townsendi]